MTEPTATATVNADLAFALEVLSPPQYAAIVDHVTAEVRSQEINRLEGKQQQINRLMMEAASFEDHVRDAFIEFASSHGVDNSDLNDVLESLELDLVETEFTVEVEVVAKQTVTVTVTATSMEAAESLVNDGDDDVRRLVDQELVSYDWDVEEYKSLEVRDY